jgi:hypothetical protein
MRLARGAKVKWALVVSGLLWVIPLVIACTVAGTPTVPEHPMGTNLEWGQLYLRLIAAGFFLTAFVSWLIAFIADAIRHALSRPRASTARL